MTAEHVHLRFAAPADLPAIFEVYHHEVLYGIATFDTVPRTLEQQRDWLARHPEADYPAIVAVGTAGAAEVEAGRVGGAVLGWATLTRWSDRPAYDRTAEVSIYVHPEHQGRGIGTHLLAELIRLAKARGRKVLIARVVDQNPGSVRYHEKLGFATVGVMHGVGEKFGRVLDVRVMEMQLEGRSG